MYGTTGLSVLRLAESGGCCAAPCQAVARHAARSTRCCAVPYPVRPAVMLRLFELLCTRSR